MSTNGANGTDGHASSALCSVNEFMSEEYDYIVVGGGTAGLCVAARLTENPDVKVGVLEYGADRMGRFLIFEFNSVSRFIADNVSLSTVR